MAYKIQISKKVTTEVIRICEYIAENWGIKAAERFFEKFYFRIHQILRYPQVGRPSKKQPEFRKILLVKRNIIYYWIEYPAIYIENLLNSYTDPRNNPYD